MALSSSSAGDRGVTGLPLPKRSSGDTGDTITASPESPWKPRILAAGDPDEPDGGNPYPLLPSLISSFLALCRRSCSLKADRRGPISPETGLGARRAGWVTGSFWDESWDAPVSRWTTARKVDGSAWTKVVLADRLGSKMVETEDEGDEKVVVLFGYEEEEEEAMRESEKESGNKGTKRGVLFCFRDRKGEKERRSADFLLLFSSFPGIYR